MPHRVRSVLAAVVLIGLVALGLWSYGNQPAEPDRSRADIVVAPAVEFRVPVTGACHDLEVWTIWFGWRTAVHGAYRDGEWHEARRDALCNAVAYLGYRFSVPERGLWRICTWSGEYCLIVAAG